jgi:general secretion pathway protein E
MERSVLLARLRRAREHSGGASTVLDRLLFGEPEPAQVCRDLAEHTGVLGVTDAAMAVSALCLESLSAAKAKSLQCLPLRWPGETVVRIGLADPWSDAQLRPVVRALGRVPELAAVSSAVLEACLAGGDSDAPAEAGFRPHDDAGVSNGSTGVVEFVDAAITQAMAIGASDIHFESDRTGIGVKFRQDGVMTPWRRIESTKRAEETISRIKVLAQLDITERRVPQDGRFRWQRASDRSAAGLDMRVSIMPSIHGEDAVLRLLDKAQGRRADQSMSLDALGFDAEQARRIRGLAALPHGMLLVTGPTGSGKTTTVYATLSEINTGLEKIVTIEDPVEYELPGVLQIPVNERKGLTFAKGLRSILTDRDAARLLGISQHTVRKHVESCMDKLGAATRTEAAILALRLGILDSMTPGVGSCRSR